MSDLHDLHNEALRLADQAFAKRRQGQLEDAKQLFSQAYELEIAAAQKTEKEPSRGILYRSAATLALHADRLRDAERTAAMGLVGDPPMEILAELREVMKKTLAQVPQ